MYVRAIAKSNAGMGSLLKNLGHGYGTTARKREGGLICAPASARPAWLPRNLSQSGGHKIYTVGRGIGAEAGANEP